MKSEISRLLRQRGHEVTKEGSDADILLPCGVNEPEIISSLKEILYNLMRRDKVRKAFRDWAYSDSPRTSISQSHINSYIDICSIFGKLDVDSQDKKQGRYSKTFEWYVSEVFRREFSARANGFGLRLKDAHPDDEFDCIALLDGGVAYVECKTGTGSIYDGITKFIRRDFAIGARYSFYIFDRDYTFTKEGEDIPLLKKKDANKIGIEEITRVSVGNKIFFQVQCGPNQMGGRWFLACGGFRGFEERLRYMIHYINESHELNSPYPPQYNLTEVPFVD